MILAAEWARTKKVPYLGICLGMQIAVIEYARHVCGLEGANSVELDERTSHPMIIFMPEIDKVNLGGTMRLGARPTIFQEDSDWSKLRALYGLDRTSVDERHRHRYEVNPEYIDRLQKAGLHFIGKDDKGERMEIVELKDHPWFVGVQFHPEYLSRVLAPSKPFLGFVSAAAGVFGEVMKMSQANEADKLANGVDHIII
jgi:CTP synthase